MVVIGSGEGSTSMRAVGVYKSRGCRWDRDVGRCKANACSRGLLQEQEGQHHTGHLGAGASAGH